MAAKVLHCTECGLTLLSLQGVALSESGWKVHERDGVICGPLILIHSPREPEPVMHDPTLFGNPLLM